MTEQYLTGFYTNFQAISRVQGAKINSRLFTVFKEPWEPLFYYNHTLYCIITGELDIEISPLQSTSKHEPDSCPYTMGVPIQLY